MRTQLQTTDPEGQQHRKVVVRRLRRYLAAIVQGAEPFGPYPLTQRGSGDEQGATEHGGPSRAGEAARGHIWPACAVPGSKAVEPEDVERLTVAMLASEEVAGGGEGAGLTVRRLKAVMETLGFDGAMIGRSAPPLVLWFSQAGVLAEPTNEATPWAAPRRLTVTTQEAVSDALRAAPPLTVDGLAEARRRGLK